MAFDGIVTKSICSELSNLSGARIDKIFEPNKNTITIGIYTNGTNYLLNICIDSQNCRIHLTTHPTSNPQIAPNFCMVLRKNLIGLHLKNIFTLDLERLVIMEFEGFDDIDDIISKKLIVELMGKHSNIILLDDQNIIIDSLRHIKQDNEEFRELLPHTRYSFPKTQKSNFFEIQTFDDFYKVLFSYLKKQNKSLPLSTIISSAFNGISKTFVDAIIQNLNGKVINLLYDIEQFQSQDTKQILENVYIEINKIISAIGTPYLSFKTLQKEDSKKIDYSLTINRITKN